MLGKKKKQTKKTLQETWLCFSELDVPKYNLIQHCSQKETDCWLLNSRNSHYLAPTVWQLEPKKKTSDSPSAKSSFTVFQRSALQSKICGWHKGQLRVNSGLREKDPRVQTSSPFKFSIFKFVQPANSIRASTLDPNHLNKAQKTNLQSYTEKALIERNVPRVRKEI